MNKRAQTAGMITGLVMGVGFLVISVIIAFVIVTNVAVIDDTTYTTSYPITVVNETVTGFNETVGDVLALFGTKNNIACTGVAVVNSSNGVVVPTANWSVTSATCNLLGLNNNVFLGYNVDVTYTYTYHQTAESADLMIGNFTSGVDNISGKIPTVLLVAAIILILGVLAVLVGVWQKMRIGGGSL